MESHSPGNSPFRAINFINGTPRIEEASAISIAAVQTVEPDASIIRQRRGVILVKSYNTWSPSSECRPTVCTQGRHLANAERSCPRSVYRCNRNRRNWADRKDWPIADRGERPRMLTIDDRVRWLNSNFIDGFESQLSRRLSCEWNRQQSGDHVAQHSGDWFIASRICAVDQSRKSFLSRCSTVQTI